MTEVKTTKGYKFERVKSIKTLIYEHIAMHPKITNKGLGKKFPDLNENTIRVYKAMFKGSKWESKHILAQLYWLYELMETKISKMHPPSKKDRDRLKVIERMIGWKG